MQMYAYFIMYMLHIILVKHQVFLLLTHTLMQPCTLHVNLVKPKNLGVLSLRLTY